MTLRHYIPPPPLMQIEQVEEVKLLEILLTTTLSMQAHIKYTIGILNQRLLSFKSTAQTGTQCQWAYLSIYGSSCCLVPVRIASARWLNFS